MKKSSLIWILRNLKNRIPSVIILTLAQMGQGFFGVLFALGSRGVIDSAVAADPDGFTRACVWQLAIIGGILVCLCVSRHLRERLRADLDRDWKRKLLTGLLNGQYARVSSYHSAELMNRLNNDVAKVDEGIVNIIPAFASMLTRLVAAVVILGALDARFTMFILLAGCVVVISTSALRRYLKRLNKQVSEHDGKVSAFLQEAMEKLLVIQSMDISDEVACRADHLLDRRYRVQCKRKTIGVLTNTGMNVIYYGAGFFALVWCAGLVMQGQMSFGSLTAVVQLVSQLQRPFLDISGVLPQYTSMVAAAERLMELDAIQGEPIAHYDANTVYENMRSIHGERITFSYGREIVLEHADFSIPKGAFAVVKGHSGMGKSTLLKLILGIFKPEEGHIYLENSEDRIMLDQKINRLFAYVPQGNLIFSGSLRDNLTIVKPQATEAEICQAVYVSAMDAFLPQLPDGLDTQLGENGAGLSEGQAQRLAIARAVLVGAPILLLDECTSALDPETERTVLQRLRDLPDRTCIAVTHGTAAEELCDWKLEISEGKIHMTQS